MSQVFLCPLCRRDLPNRSRAWPLQARGPILRCTNPGCDGRFAADPFPIIHAAPGIAFERMIQPPAAVPLEALGMMLRSLPPDSHLLHALEQRSKHLWAQFHDLLPDLYRPDFVHPAPFTLRALGLLDHASLHPGAQALVVGAGPGRAAFELAWRLTRLGDLLSPAHENTAKHSYPTVYALDLDPSLLLLLRALSKGPLDLLLRASPDGWHSPQRVELHDNLRRCADLIQPVCADILAPPFDAASFDLVVCLNLLERTAAPLDLLLHLQRLLKPGGLLLLSSAFAWDDKLTPRDARLSALVPHARRPDVELLQELLSGRLGVGARFDLYSVAVMNPTPSFQRHHDTSLSANLSYVSLWRRPTNSAPPAP